MNTPDLGELRWCKSSYSGNDGGDCVEIAALPSAAAIRDSKNPDGGALVLSHVAWRALGAALT
ncbi:uncharacterized protein DUF397 [Herbihabitans rhizosphaerae]|uniref:Uncharacterized protein DUF397 n=1 Tax=Herbihabitans rhizosphaerae TaxID=1872711 RepID=A0A4Q7L674_9PSEU|nr:DUF397 domain-containing protein [Herbihabitans rhizosphaerae]RZS44350.1 uncharacterized protein DUF397 [Herbihabitans rhizosphaerae]